MNCSLHKNATATNTCDICGAGICKDCVEQTKEWGTICISCASKLIREEIADTSAASTMLKKSSNNLLTCWLIGIPMFIMGIVFLFVDGVNVFFPFLFLPAGSLLSGIPSGIALWKYSDSGPIMKIVLFIVGLNFGFLIAPFQVGIYKSRSKSLAADIPGFNAMLKRLNSFKLS